MLNFASCRKAEGEGNMQPEVLVVPTIVYCAKLTILELLIFYLSKVS